MFVEGGYDKKMKGLETERHVFWKTERQKKQIMDWNKGRQKDKKNKIRNRILEDRKMNVRGQKDIKDRLWTETGEDRKT